MYAIKINSEGQFVIDVGDRVLPVGLIADHDGNVKWDVIRSAEPDDEVGQSV